MNGPNGSEIVERAFLDLIDLYHTADYTPGERKLLTDPVMYYGRMIEPSTRAYALATLARNVGRAIAFLRPANGAAPPTVLDVGCGLGMNSLILAGLGFHVVGVDLNPDVVALATKQRAIFERRWQRPLHAKFIAADFHAFAETAQTATFDCVFSMSAFAHIPPLSKTVGEIARLSKPSNAKVFLWDINRPVANANFPSLGAVKREFAAAGFTRQSSTGGTVVPRQVWRAPTALYPAIRAVDQLLCQMVPSIAFTYVCELTR